MSKEKYGHETNINLGLFGENYTTNSKIVAWTDPFGIKFKPTIETRFGYLFTNVSWNTAEKYLDEFQSKRWVIKRKRGTLIYWEADRGR